MPVISDFNICPNWKQNYNMGKKHLTLGTTITNRLISDHNASVITKASHQKLLDDTHALKSYPRMQFKMRKIKN